MLLQLVVILTYCLFGFANAYTKPNYPGRPLTKEDNQKLLSNCGRPPMDHIQQKIWNPDMVNRTEALWVVAVLSSTTRWTPNMTTEEMYKYPSSICSGTLISSRHVLTAAHCIKQNILRQYFVIDFECARNNTNCNGDPMYLRKAARLTEDIPMSIEVWPACLADTEVLVGEKLDLYGYGTHGTQNSFYALQHAPVVAAKCRNTTLDQFCSYVPYQKPCGGGSGAGLIRTDRHGRKHVVGVHKVGKFCDYSNENAVFGPEDTSEKMHTGIKLHLYWVCEATGICADGEIEKDVELWKSLPNRHRKRYSIQEPLEENEIYV